jgi:hypothetical protein
VNLAWHPALGLLSAHHNDERSLQFFTLDGSLRYTLDGASAVLPSPDGRWLLVEGEQGLRLYDANGALVTVINDSEGGWAATLPAHWSADSRVFYRSVQEEDDLAPGIYYFAETNGWEPALVIPNAGFVWDYWSQAPLPFVITP